MVYVKVTVSPLEQPERAESCEILADTGATLTVLPSALLDRLGILPQWELNFGLADGRGIRRRVGRARVTLNGGEAFTRVVFGHPEDTPILGLMVLEELGLAVDPTNRRLIPTKYLLL